MSSAGKFSAGEAPPAMETTSGVSSVMIMGRVSTLAAALCEVDNEDDRFGEGG